VCSTFRCRTHTINNVFNVFHLVYGTGGLERVCIINDEEHVVCGKMRFSGDLVKQMEGGLLCYVRRQDDMIKRHGKRIHLHEIEQVKNSLLAYTLCGLWSGHGRWCFNGTQCLRSVSLRSICLSANIKLLQYFWNGCRSIHPCLFAESKIHVANSMR